MALVVLPLAEEYKHAGYCGNSPYCDRGCNRIEAFVQSVEYQSRENQNRKKSKDNPEKRGANCIPSHQIIRVVPLLHLFFRHFNNALSSTRNNLIILSQGLRLRKWAGIKLLLKLNSGLYLFLSRFCISHMLVLCRHLRSSSPAICYRNQYGSHVSCGAAKWGSQPRKKRKENLL